MVSGPHAPQAAPPTPRDLDTTKLFVTRSGSSLLLGGQPFRFASLNAPELLDGDVNGPFEVEDTFQSFATGAFGRVPVTRTYTLRVKSGRISRGHINGWNASWGDWEWDSGRMKEMDEVLDAAARNGVRLIIPLVNADCDGQATNWVGDLTDLIRFRKGFSTYEEARAVDFYTDLQMINAFKLIIDKLLNRTNSVNGRLYKDDPTILAWETGNELHYRGYQPAPGAWTAMIARHLKDRAPNTLVMDGSFARTDNVDSCYAKEALESPDVDLFSYHYYGIDGMYRLKKDVELARKYGKAFVVGEYGFFNRTSDYDDFLSKVDSSGAAGSLVWSLRPHSSKGGFKTHGEDHGNWSYHVPGWPQPLHGEFDSREASIIISIRKAAYKINKERLPPYPTPLPPQKLWIAASPTQICWLGSAWAHRYELVVRNVETGQELGRREVLDCTKEGCLSVDCTTELRLWGSVSIRMTAVSVDGVASEESEQQLVMGR